MYYTHDFSNEVFASREKCEEELLDRMDSLDIAEFLAQRVSLSDIVDERATRDPEDFYDWLDREIEIATNAYLEWHINEHNESKFPENSWNQEYMTCYNLQ